MVKTSRKQIQFPESARRSRRETIHRPILRKCDFTKSVSKMGLDLRHVGPEWGFTASRANMRFYALLPQKAGSCAPNRKTRFYALWLRTGILRHHVQNGISLTRVQKNGISRDVVPKMRFILRPQAPQWGFTASLSKMGF